MKRLKIFLIAILSIVLLGYFSIGGIHFLEEKQKQERIESGVFRFEDYDTVEEVQDALDKLHPIATDSDNLLSTLKNAGGNVRCSEPKELKKMAISEGSKLEANYSFYCNYTKLHSWKNFDNSHWLVTTFLIPNTKKIKKVTVSVTIGKIIKLVPDVTPTLSNEEINRQTEEINRMKVELENLDTTIEPSQILIRRK